MYIWINSVHVHMQTSAWQTTNLPLVQTSKQKLQCTTGNWTVVGNKCALQQILTQMNLCDEDGLMCFDDVNEDDDYHHLAK